MKVLIFTNDDGPESRQALEFGGNLESEGYEVEYLKADDEQVTPKVELYDVYSYPTFVAVRDDGTEIECWRGMLPIPSDVKLVLNQ